MTPIELTRALQAGRIDPLYCVTGEESWLIDEALAAFRGHVVPADDLLNTHVYSGAEVSGAEVASMADTLPAFATHRLILVRDAERLAASDALDAYCARPSTTTCLVLVMAKPDRRKTWIQHLLKQASMVTCEPLSGRALKQWITASAANRGMQLADDVLAYLQERSGGSLRAVAQDLEQLALNRGGDSSPVRLANLDALSPGEVRVSVFEWAHEVALGHTRMALRQLQTLLDDEAPLLLMAIVTGQWRKMVRCRRLLDRGVPPGQMAQALEVPPFAVGRLVDATKAHRAGDLVRGLTWCLETDATLKGGALAGPLALERLVMMLCEGAVTSPPGRSLTGAWWPGLLARREAVGVTGQTRNQT